MSKLVGDHESFSAGFMPAASPPSSASKLLGDGTLGHLQRQLTRFSKIEFSSTQIGQLLDAQELIRARPPQRGQVALAEFFQALHEPVVVQGVQYHKEIGRASCRERV